MAFFDNLFFIKINTLAVQAQANMVVWLNGLVVSVLGIRAPGPPVRFPGRATIPLGMKIISSSPSQVHRLCK